MELTTLVLTLNRLLLLLVRLLNRLILIFRFPVSMIGRVRLACSVLTVVYVVIVRVIPFVRFESSVQARTRVLTPLALCVLLSLKKRTDSRVAKLSVRKLVIRKVLLLSVEMVILRRRNVLIVFVLGVMLLVVKFVNRLAVTLLLTLSFVLLVILILSLLILSLRLRGAGELGCTVLTFLLPAKSPATLYWVVVEKSMNPSDGDAKARHGDA